MRYVDEKGRVCDPDKECLGQGRHYHCVQCWTIGGMMGHYRDDRFTCQSEESQ